MRIYSVLVSAIVLIAVVTFVIEVRIYYRPSSLLDSKEQFLATYVNISTRLRHIYEVPKEITASPEQNPSSPISHITPQSPPSPPPPPPPPPRAPRIQTIYLAFDVASEDFHYINYKSLESLLVTYPNAVIRVLIIGPQAADYYRIGHLLSKKTFEKYKKRGYNINFEVLHANHGLLSTSPPPYWQEIQDQFCTVNKVGAMKHSQSELPPYHAYVYAALRLLQIQPGLFLDFNFYHRQPLSGVTTGSLVHCGEHIADTMSAAAVTNSCRPSVLLLLMQSQTSRSLSSCMLDQYYNSSTFLRCLKTETDSGGAVCISAALNKCYSSLDIENQLTVPSDLLGQSMLFLGSLSQNISQDWYLPPPASDLARMITDTSQRLKPYKYTSNITCHRYRSFNSQRIESEYLARYLSSFQVDYASRTSKLTKLGFMKSGTSFLFEALAHHPQVVHALSGVVFKETGCYLPEQNRPQYEHMRVQCFPFIEEHDQAIYGDGTVYYSMRRETPDNPDIKAIFVLRAPLSRLVSHYKFSHAIMLRNGLANINEAVEHAFSIADISNHTFDFGNYSSLVNVPQATAMLVKHLQNSLRDCLSDKSSEAYALCGAYLDCVLFKDFRIEDNKSRQSTSLLRHSTYAPALMHWLRVIGPTRIRTVQSADMIVDKQGSKRLAKTLADIHNFLELVPHSYVPSAPFHQTKILNESLAVLTEENQNRLESYFESLVVLSDMLVKYIDSSISL